MSNIKTTDQKLKTGHTPSSPEIPENPLNPPISVRFLKISITIMSILLVAGIVVIIATIIYRSLNHEGNKIATKGVPQNFSKLDVEVDNDMIVSQIEIDGDRMAVHMTRALMDEILIINISSGELIGRVKLKKKATGMKKERSPAPQ